MMTPPRNPTARPPSPRPTVPPFPRFSPTALDASTALATSAALGLSLAALPTPARAAECARAAGTGLRGTDGRGVVPLWDGNGRIVAPLFPGETVTPTGNARDGKREVTTSWGRMGWLAPPDADFDACARGSSTPPGDQAVVVCGDAQAPSLFLRSAPQRRDATPVRVVGFSDALGAGSFRLISSTEKLGAQGKGNVVAYGEGIYAPSASGTRAKLRNISFSNDGPGETLRVRLRGDGFERVFAECGWARASAILDRKGRFRIATCSGGPAGAANLLLARGDDGAPQRFDLELSATEERITVPIRALNTRQDGFINVVSADVDMPLDPRARIEIEIGASNAEHALVVTRSGFVERYEGCALENLPLLSVAIGGGTKP